MINKARQKKREMFSYIYILPSFLIMFIFIMIPIILSIVMSFFDIRSFDVKWIFVGLKNFSYAFKDAYFLDSFLRTIGFGIFGVATGLFFGLLLSLLVAKHKYLNFYRYIFYLPSVVSAITMGRLWNMMLTPSETGLFNSVVTKLFNIPMVNWLGNEKIAYLVVLGVGLIGVGGGMTMVLFTTGINNIPPDLYEAAELEGASFYVTATKITIPMISPIISSWLLLSIIASFKSFEFIYALTGGGPNASTTTIAILLYQETKNNSLGFGVSSAMGLILTLIVMVFATLYLFNSKINKESEIEM